VVEGVNSIDFQVPVRTVSEMNDRSHWSVKMRRKQDQQQQVAVAWQNNLKGRRIQLPCVVKLTRIGPRVLDGDNLQASCKGIRDTIAQKLGADDGSDLIKWEYSQVKNGSKEYGLKISITSLEP
jgi:hypothetical protein